MTHFKDLNVTFDSASDEFVLEDGTSIKGPMAARIFALWTANQPKGPCRCEWPYTCGPCSTRKN